MLAHARHLRWYVLAGRAAVTMLALALIAGCTVYPTPTSYNYVQTACPPGLGTAQAVPTSVQAPQGGQPPANAPTSAVAPAAPLGAGPNTSAGGTPPAAINCYIAVPNYAYDYYPAYAYPAYPYAYPYYPYYYPYYGGVWIGGHWGWHR